MKKFFTLALLALGLTFASEANAQSSLRKTWDFRTGFSTKTINALKADQEEFGDNKYWRNYEGDATKADEQHYWNASKDARNSDGYACTHNGGNEKVIPELEGLVLGMSNAKKFVITYNGAQKANEYTDGGVEAGVMIPYGKSYIWLNGKNETIKFMAAVNQTIKIGVESHAVATNKLGEARGISLSTSVGSLELTQGNAVPTYYTECEWNLTGNDGEIAELTIKTTNGCHIYYIIVGEGDEAGANKTKVGYLTNGDASTEEAYTLLTSNEELAVTPIDAAQFATANMADYDVTVVSPALPADHAAVAAIKSGLAFYPILNLNPQLYAAWEYGEAVGNNMSLGAVSNLKNDLMAGLEEGVDYEMAEDLAAISVTNDENYTGVILRDYFADDDVVMTNGSEDGFVAIHTHNIFQNGYVFMPIQNATATMTKILFNAISTLKDSKAEITKAPAPKIDFEYKNLQTRVSMAMPSNIYKLVKIYYTTDGTEPTENSTLYTDTIIVTEPTTFKAVGLADGYLLSEASEATAEIYSQPATPVFNVTFEDGKSIATISCETENITLWYNFSETTDTTKSMKYTEPIEVALPTTITAFAVAGGMVFSEPAVKRVVVKDPVVRQDQIGLFDANAADWQKGGSGSTVYYFSWGKNAASIYDTTAEPIGTSQDPETGDEIPVYPERDYEYYMPTPAEEGAEAKWEVKSKGQVMIWQNLSAGGDPGNDSGYNPESAGDILSYAKICNHDIQFGGKTSGERCTGAIQSRTKYQGPFDVVTHLGTSAGGENVAKILVEVSVDSLEWTVVGDTMTTSTVKRLWKTYTRSYNETDEVYVRVTQAGGGSGAQIYDIYILNEGENSLALKEDYKKEYEDALSGIQELKSVTNVPAGVYNINGIRMKDVQRGLNIVVDANGKVSKVIIK